MTTATAGLTVSAIAELLESAGYRITISTDDVIAGERPVLGTHVLRRVVGQRNTDETFRLGFLFARPGQTGGLPYQHDLMARLERCDSLVELIGWLVDQNVRPFPAKVGS